MGRRKRRLVNVKALVMSILLVVLTVYGGYAGAKYLLMPYLFPPIGMTEEQPLLAERMNLVLLGVDAQEGDESRSRADSILFVSADPEQQRVALLSIPRDTRVNIQGHGWDKINAASVHGGPELTRRVVSNLLGLPVDYYVETNFEGFREIVDVLGGVTIDVDRRMYYRDPLASPPLVIDLQPGEQRLDGDKALQYVRYRCDGLGDITRIQRQQRFLMALADEMMKPRNIVKLPKLVPKINACIDTNMPLREMIRWAGFARNLVGVEMLSATLPGSFMDYNGLSYWYVDPARAKEVATKLINGEEIGDPLLEHAGPVMGVAYQPEPEPEPTPQKPEQSALSDVTPPVGLDGQGGGEELPPDDPIGEETSEEPGAVQEIPQDVVDWPQGPPDVGQPSVNVES